MAVRRAAPKAPPPLYPLRFHEIYKKKIWGGDALRKALKKRGVPPKTGESYEVSHLGKDVSVVANGKLRGKSLKDLWPTLRRPLLGEDVWMRFPDGFPLLIKFLNAKERLSLQVHPNDEFASRYEPGNWGKMEAWYVVHAPKEARVIRGVLPGITVAEFKQCLAEGRIEECLNNMQVEEGDVIFIPPGTIHTAFGNLVVLEVQQASDITYRLTDWNRKDFSGKARPLDTTKAIAVTDFYTMGVTKFRPQRLPGFSYKRKLLLKCEKFTMDLMELTGRIKEKLDGSRFQVLSVIRGKGLLRYGPKFKGREPFALGQTFLIPAAMGDYEVRPSGRTEIVVTYI